MLVTPMEGDPIAGFELDSKLHTDPAVKQRDQYKNDLFSAAHIPLFRFESEDPNATGVDEWFSLLTDQVLDKVSVGERIRTRDLHETLVPIFR